ncbi:hypothetical protein ACOSQ2_031512 [Xanthoceras sorbifolium]
MMCRKRVIKFLVHWAVTLTGTDMHSTTGPVRSEWQQAEGNEEGEVIVALNLVKERLWGFFVQQPIPTSLKVVSEFYAAMVQEVFDNGVLNPKCIAYGDALVQDLGTIGQPTQTLSGIVMFREQLKLDSAFWNEFSYYSVLPSEQGAILSKNMACFIYAIRYNLPINIGYLIRQSMAKMGKVGVGKICFPSLITHFCAAAGVYVYGEDEIVIQPPPNLDWATYKALGLGQHDPDFVSRRCVRSRIDEDLEDVNDKFQYLNERV